MTSCRLSRLCLLSLSAVVYGCSGSTREPFTAASLGYSLLHDLLSRDAHADKILWVKFESDTVDALMTDIVELCTDGKEVIEGFAKSDELHVDLDLQPLPAIELETRASIESETADELLDASGVEFEARLLITQLRVFRYAANLCRVLRKHESSESRKRFLEDFAERCNAMRERIFRTILELPSTE